MRDSPFSSPLGVFRVELTSIGITSVRELGLNTETMLKSIHPFNRMNLFYEVRTLLSFTLSLYD